MLHDNKTELQYKQSPSREIKIDKFTSSFPILIANQNKAIFATEIICITKVKTMKEIREKINSIDDRMLKLLAERRQLSIEIIKFKNEEKSSIRDKEREKQVLTRLLEVGREYGLDTHYVYQNLPGNY